MLYSCTRMATVGVKAVKGLTVDSGNSGNVTQEGEGHLLSPTVGHG